MDTLSTRIRVRSQREAMDFSLVLASQGIETTIDHAEKDGEWGLLVPSGEADRAREAIRLYVRENRRWRWARELLPEPADLDAASLAWVTLVAFFYLLQTQLGIEDRAIFDSGAVQHGQWWRLFTAAWLHADPGHLALNLIFGALLLGLVLHLYGRALGFLGTVATGFLANLIALPLALPSHRSLGASGMVMGALGLLTVHSLANWRKTPHGRKYLLAALSGGVMLFVLLGTDPSSDVLVHAGGFASGIVLGVPLAALAAVSPKRAINLFAGGATALLILVPWAFALHR